VAQSSGPTRAKVGLISSISLGGPPGVGVISTFALPMCKEGWCTGYPMPKVGGGRVGWPQINGGAHSLHLYIPHTPVGEMEIRK
jgi:hypothetical protein